MRPHRSPTRARRARGGLVGALVLAASLVGVLSPGPIAAAAGSHTAASTSAGATNPGADLVRFAVGSPAMVQAELIAVKYWGTSPCAGVVGVSWSALDGSVNAASNWWNPIAAYGNAGANTQCRITFNQAEDFNWPMFCTVMVHEIGHLTGHEHSPDQTSVMYPIYVAPIPECQVPAVDAASAAPVTAAASAASAQPGSGHKAHSTRKTHKRHSAKQHH